MGSEESGGVGPVGLEMARKWLMLWFEVGWREEEIWEFLEKWALSHFGGFEWGSSGLEESPVVAWDCRARLGLGVHGVGWM